MHLIGINDGLVGYYVDEYTHIPCVTTTCVVIVVVTLKEERNLVS